MGYLKKKKEEGAMKLGGGMGVWVGSGSDWERDEGDYDQNVLYAL